MAYQVKFTETTNPAKPSITVDDQTLNTETSVTFVGKNYAGYAPVIAENFLHLLENFARNTAPGTQTGDGQPVEGQVWYDNSPGITLLKVFDGTIWKEVGSVKKAGKSSFPAGAPSPATSTKGDLWVDTDNQQLYLYSGSAWLLIGPQYSAGLKTGPQIETIADTDNVDRSVLTLYADDARMAIISNVAFTPKTTISGFTTIGKGVNLSSIDATSTTSPNKFWGTASKSDALVVNGQTVGSINFLRSDVTSTTNYPINIRNGAGISLGSDLSFNISTDVNTAILYSKTSGNSIDIKVNSNGNPTTLIHVDAAGRVGIGPNNTAPTEALDVLGNVVTSGTITSLDTTDSSELGQGSIVTSGGLSIAKNSNFGGDVTTYGKVYVNNLDLTDAPVAGAVILPGSDSASSLYDIGSTARKFRNIYADSFVGNFSGSFTGPLNGSISGSAAKLASPTVFSITGDVSTTESKSFDGQSIDGTLVFNTVINPDIITAKTAVTSTLLTDLLLIYRSGVDGGLKKVTKENFINNIPTVPVGVMMPYAGSVAPAGYLLCDGSEVKIGDYAQLFAVIGYAYKTPSLLVGQSTFALPDMRGRFPLGRDDMDNNLMVPDKNDPNVLRDAGGGSANRVTDVVADTLGAGSGTEQKTLNVNNLPPHRHTLNSGVAEYYAAGLPGGVPDGNAVSGRGLPETSTGYGFPNTGGVDFNGAVGQPVGIMNPYLTINYIIFTGVL